MAQEMRLPLDQAWKNWEACLNRNDPNSIFRQITTMIWDTGVYRIILAGRQLKVEKNPQSPELNDTLHFFIDRNYFHSQSLIIRRITDDRYPLTGKMGVFSLKALLKDIESYKKELTRETFLELRNMPYDYKEIQSRELKYALSQPAGTAFFIPPELDWESIEDAHSVFDRLANLSANNRNPEDQIDSNVFRRLHERLTLCTEISLYADKFIAHSSTPESRVSQNYDETTITVDKLWKAHRVIFNVALFLSETIFGIDRMALAIENPSLFMFWEKPLFENGEFDSIRDSFDKYRKETETWQSDGVEDIWRAIEENRL